MERIDKWLQTPLTKGGKKIDEHELGNLEPVLLGEIFGVGCSKECVGAGKGWDGVGLSGRSCNKLYFIIVRSWKEWDEVERTWKEAEEVGRSWKE